MYRRNKFVKIFKKVVLFFKISTFLLLSRPLILSLRFHPERRKYQVFGLSGLKLTITMFVVVSSSLSSSSSSSYSPSSPLLYKSKIKRLFHLGYTYLWASNISAIIHYTRPFRALRARRVKRWASIICSVLVYKFNPCLLVC